MGRNSSNVKYGNVHIQTYKGLTLLGGTTLMTSAYSLGRICIVPKCSKSFTLSANREVELFFPSASLQASLLMFLAKEEGAAVLTEQANSS